MAQGKDGSRAVAIIALAIFAGSIGFPLYTFYSCSRDINEAEERRDRERPEHVANVSATISAHKTLLEATRPRLLSDVVGRLGEPTWCDNESEVCSWDFTSGDVTKRIRVELQLSGVPPKIRNGSPVRSISYD